MPNLQIGWVTVISIPHVVPVSYLLFHNFPHLSLMMLIFWVPVSLGSTQYLELVGLWSCGRAWLHVVA